MSVKSQLKKTSEHRMQDSNLLTLSEHLTDSHILLSKKTYGKKKSLPISSENGTSVSETVSEQLENMTLLKSNYNEELIVEEHFKSVASVTSNCSNVEEGKKELKLFSDEDTDFYFSISTDSEKDHDSFPATPEASSSGSNYQRTRKNLKNRLSRQRYSSEEMSESTSQEENSNSVNESISASNFLDQKQTPSSPKQTIVSNGNQAEHKRDGIENSNTSVNKLSEKPIIFQKPNQAGNPLKNSSNGFSILELVNRFSASNNKDTKKNNCNKRKRIKQDWESVPAEKKLAVKHSVSSKVNYVKEEIVSSKLNSVEKISNSLVSVRNYSKSPISKNESAVSYQGALKKRDVTPSKAVKKGNDKTPSKAVKKGNDTTPSKAVQMLQKFVLKKKITENSTPPKIKCPSSSLATSDLHLVRNETAEKIQPDYGDKQMEVPPFVQSNDCTFQNQTLNNISEKNFASNFDLRMPMIIAPNPPISHMVPLYVWCTPLPIIDNSTQSDNRAITYENFKDLSIPGPSTLNNDYSSMKHSDYYVKNLHADEKMCLINRNTTTTTINLNRYDQQKSDFRPRTHLNDGVDFHQFVNNSLKNIQDNCILKCKEQSNKIFSMNPSLRNITVKDFCDNPDLTDILLDYVNELDMAKPLFVCHRNKGYDFPENFESENLLRVVKDFVQTAISCIIPASAPKPLPLSYSQIIKTAMLQMSSREFIVMTHVFRKTEHLYKLKDVVSRLSFVALFVIFDEYNNKKNR